jgi:MerR family mercuric resistance operon transcriptional regulator
MTTIGGASRLSGVNIETIRYYEKRGLLPPPPRAAGRRRHFDEALIGRLIFIRRGRELGFSLDDIRNLLAAADRRLTCNQVHKLATRHVAQIRERTRVLRRIAQVLTATANKCQRGNRPECPIIDVVRGTALKTE